MVQDLPKGCNLTVRCSFKTVCNCNLRLIMFLRPFLIAAHLEPGLVCLYISINDLTRSHLFLCIPLDLPFQKLKGCGRTRYTGRRKHSEGNVVLLSACADYEKAHESKRGGLFTAVRHDCTTQVPSKLTHEYAFLQKIVATLRKTIPLIA